MRNEIGREASAVADVASQKPYPQLVLFGDSLFQASVEVQNGFSFHAALQASKSAPDLILFCPRDAGLCGQILLFSPLGKVFFG